MGLTPIRLDASGSTGESLSYLIELGDGTTSSDQRTVRSVMAAGSLAARLTVTDKYGRTDSVIVPFKVASLATISGWHNWSGNYYRNLRIDTHVGRVISGLYLRWLPGIENGLPGVTFSGTLLGERGIALTFDDGSARFDGAVTDPLPGKCGIFPQLRLTIRGSHPDGGSTLSFENDFSGC